MRILIALMLMMTFQVQAEEAKTLEEDITCDVAVFLDKPVKMTLDYVAKEKTLYMQYKQEEQTIRRVYRKNVEFKETIYSSAFFPNYELVISGGAAGPDLFLNVVFNKPYYSVTSAKFYPISAYYGAYRESFGGCKLKK